MSHNIRFGYVKRSCGFLKTGVFDAFEAVKEFFVLLPGTITALLVELCNAVPTLRPVLETLEKWLAPIELWAELLLLFGLLLGWLLKGLKIKWAGQLGGLIFRGCTLAVMLSIFWVAGKVTGEYVKDMLQ